MQRILIALLFLLSCAYATDVGQVADLGLGPVPGSGGGGTTTLSGDATGPSTATVVQAINGASLGSTTPTGGNLLVGNVTNNQWVSVPVSADATLAPSGALSVVGIKGTAIGNGTAGFNYMMLAAGNGTASWTNVTGDIGAGGSFGQFLLQGTTQARTDIGLGTGNIPQFAGMTSTGLTLTQTLTATGAANLAGVACTSLVNSGAETVNTLNATGAATIAGALSATGVVTVSNATDATALGTGAVVITTGGLSIAGQIRVSGVITTTNSLSVTGGGKTITCGSSITGASLATSGAADSTSAASGAIQTLGGIGVTKGLCAGGGFMDGSNVTASFSNAGTTTIAANVLTEINTNTSTLAAYTLNLPASPNNGQIVEFVSEGTITALTMSGNGHTLVGGATTITGPAKQAYIYNTAATTWYREQ